MAAAPLSAALRGTSAALTPACATMVMPPTSITELRPTRRWALRLGAAGPTGASRTRSAPDAATCSRAGSMAPRAGSGYRFALPLVAVTPYGAFQAQRLYLPAYSEVAPAGSPFALTYNAQNFATTRSELGAWFDRLVLVADTYAATVFARAAWAHDWRNDRALSTNFLTLPTPAFIIDGAAPPPDKA